MPDRLDEYRAKRKAEATPEPFGGSTSPRPYLFVVQKHAATSLHYDLRLEYRGILLSWAVPKGPSSDPEIKRLAMRTEDHPLEYADFEGRIPDGNYGAGQVIVWDQGQWVPLEDPEAGLGKGKLLLELRGHKLRGIWTIFRTKKDGKPSNEWLLLKKPDAYAGDEYAETSIFSGLGIGDEPAPLDLDGVPEGEVEPEVMLAEPEGRAFSRKGWIYEQKYDGFRMLCRPDALTYRSGRDATSLYPELLRSLRLLPFRDFLIDGEIVVLDEEGKPDFQRLQKRGQFSNARDIERASVALPVVCYCFDLLAVDGRDLRGLPLLRRKALLKRMLPAAGPLRYCDHVEEQGEALYAQVERMGLEGIVAKKADSPYRAGRFPEWRKIRSDPRDNFVVVGWTAPKGSRTGLGALHVAAYEGEDLVYMGRVGSGFSDKLLRELEETLPGLEVEQPPCLGATPKTAGHHWVSPELVAEVRYKERTADGLLRQPAFFGLKDTPLRECTAPAARAPEPPARVAVAPTREFTPTNLDKVFWPGARYTKGDLIDYYRAIAPWLLPFLRDRPVVLTRYPDGIDGKSFFQKDAPKWVPEWIRTERVYSKRTERDIEYFVVDDADSLAFLANLGTIPLHIWSSRVTDLAKPDWCILDLDPKGAPLSDVVTCAQAIKKLCDQIELPSFVKTSGSTGLHVLLPLAGQLTYEQSRTLGELIARVIEARLPDVATTARVIEKRAGKVYLDYVQNGHGQLIAAPYSARPLPGAPASAPLRWSEVNGELDIAQFTIKTLPARMQRMKADPLLGVLESRPDLMAILGRLLGYAE